MPLWFFYSHDEADKVFIVGVSGFFCDNLKGKTGQ